MKEEKLNFGCGKKIISWWVNADRVGLPGVDHVFEFEEFPYPFKDNKFNEILADNVLEHFTNVDVVIKELHRISKPNAIWHVIVPHYNHHLAWEDITHKHLFTPRSFHNYERRDNLHYIHDIELKVLKVTLIPSPVGRLVPFFRQFIGQIFGNVIERIEYELQVIK